MRRIKETRRGDFSGPVQRARHDARRHHRNVSCDSGAHSPPPPRLRTTARHSTTSGSLRLRRLRHDGGARGRGSASAASGRGAALRRERSALDSATRQVAARRRSRDRRASCSTSRRSTASAASCCAKSPAATASRRRRWRATSSKPTCLPPKTSLSTPAMEALAIVAHLQPVTRSEIESIRGVNSDSVVSTLLDRGLIAEAGTQRRRRAADAVQDDAVLFGIVWTAIARRSARARAGTRASARVRSWRRKSRSNRCASGCTCTSPAATQRRSQHAKATGCSRDASLLDESAQLSHDGDRRRGARSVRAASARGRPRSVRDPHAVSDQSRQRRSEDLRTARCSFLKTISPSRRAAACASSTRISARTERAIAARASARSAARSRAALAGIEPERLSRLENSAGAGNLGRRHARGAWRNRCDVSSIRSWRSVSIPRTRGLRAMRSTPSEGVDRFVEEAEREIGLDRLVMFHFNDTASALGAGRDRHWHIGEGRIGFEGFRALLAHPELREKTAILETPGSDEDDLRNMQTILAIQKGARQIKTGGLERRPFSVSTVVPRRREGAAGAGSTRGRAPSRLGWIFSRRSTSLMSETSGAVADWIAEHLKPLDGCGNLQSLYSGDSNLSTVYR